MLGPFSLDEVYAQLSSRKITNDGEMRRQGWEVLEKDELWGKIRDFQIKGYGGPAGRQEVYALKAKAKQLLAVGIALLVITLGAFIGMFFIPFQEAETKMKEARAVEAAARQENANFRRRVEDEVATAKKQWSAEFDANLKQWEADKAKVARDLERANQSLRTAEMSLGAEKTGTQRLQGELDAALRNIETATKAKEKAMAELTRIEQGYRQKFEALNSSFESRVSRAEATLKQEFESLIERQRASSKGELLKPLANPMMARVLPMTNQGQGKLILLVAQRPKPGTKMELFDGSKSLRVSVPVQALAPPLMVVDVEPGQAESASGLGFLDLEVLMRPVR